jgi:hypothetical protein
VPAPKGGGWWQATAVVFIGRHFLPASIDWGRVTFKNNLKIFVLF